MSAGRRTPEYFGTGRIGDIWRDTEISVGAPKRTWRWYYEIVDYQPFPAPVPFRVGGETLENIPNNQWGTAVRRLPRETYDRILELANLPGDEVLDTKPVLPSIQNQELAPVGAEGDLLAPLMTTGANENSLGGGKRPHTRYAKKVGDRAEELVYRLLVQKDKSNVQWVASQGLHPGWDIQYEENGAIVAVEVKGTSGEAFASVELTNNELSAARENRKSFWLYLVADCLGKEPRLQCLQDPWGLIEVGDLEANPTGWRLARRTGSAAETAP